MLAHVTALLAKRPTVGARFAVPSRDLLASPAVGVYVVDIWIGLVFRVVRVGTHCFTFRDGSPIMGSLKGMSGGGHVKRDLPRFLFNIQPLMQPQRHEEVHKLRPRQSPEGLQHLIR